MANIEIFLYMKSMTMCKIEDVALKLDISKVYD